MAYCLCRPFGSVFACVFLYFLAKSRPNELLPQKPNSRVIETSAVAIGSKSSASPENAIQLV